ncbi:hypothetical protein D1007_46460 [Hordeum vulgare]|nr:hypothetical protein D1007_46460 [Hordeum vulgare]
MVLMEAASTSTGSIQEDEGGMHGTVGRGQCEPRAGEAVRMSGAEPVRPGVGTMARRWWRVWHVGVRIGSKARQLMVGGKAAGLIRSSRRAGGQVARRQRSSKAPSMLFSVHHQQGRGRLMCGSGQPPRPRIPGVVRRRQAVPAHRL